MKGKINDFELKLYEKLGIKKFKKYIIGLKDSLIDTKYMNNPKGKEEYKKKHTNYSLGTAKTLDDLKSHKKEMLFNGIVHTMSLISCISILATTPVVLPLSALNLIGYTSTLLVTVINTYCVMLQRYNWIRFDKVIEKNNASDMKKKQKAKKELKEKDKELSEHKYKVKKVSKRFSKEKEVTLDEIVEHATLSELREYRKRLIAAEERLNTQEDNRVEMQLPTTHYKSLKLELKPTAKSKTVA